MAEVIIPTKSLYPRKDSLEDVQRYLEAQLPITSVNHLSAALGLYHNTLLYKLNREKTDERP